MEKIEEPLSDAVPVKMDWTNAISLESATKGMDVVVHAAGLDAKLCAANAIKALEVNGLHTAMMVEATVASGVQHFIYISTAHVYKNPMIGDIDETTPTMNLHPYATSKLAGENVVLRATQMSRIKGIVLRLSNGSGYPIFPDTKCWHLILNDLCRQAVVGKKLIIYSENHIERNFIPMSSVCVGINRFILSSDKNLCMSPINLCSERSHSLQQIACLIAKRCKLVMGYDLEIIFKSNVENTEYNSALNLSSKKIEEYVLTIEHNLNQEIDNTLLFCKNNFVQLN